MMTSNKAVLLGIPIEAGAGRRGCVMGPAAYRTAVFPVSTYGPDLRL